MLTNAKIKEFGQNIAKQREKRFILDIRQARLNTLSIERFGRLFRPGGGE